jgi:hypothetical protein
VCGVTEDDGGASLLIRVPAQEGQPGGAEILQGYSAVANAVWRGAYYSEGLGQVQVHSHSLSLSLLFAFASN